MIKQRSNPPTRNSPYVVIGLPILVALIGIVGVLISKYGDNGIPAEGGIAIEQTVERGGTGVVNTGLGDVYVEGSKDE